MDLWVVWSVVQSFPAEDYLFLPSGDPSDRWSYSSSHDPSKYWRFRFTIQPEEIITADEKPNLKGENSTNPPGFGIKHHRLDPYPSDHADHKWDVSRQLEITIANPDLIPQDKFPPLLEYADQPKALNIPTPFPNNPVQGNDDVGGPGWLDEDSNPYDAYNNISHKNLHHEIGQLTSSDRPEVKFLTSSGVSGSTLGFVINFKEFARLNLISSTTDATDGKGWYRISDYCLWHYVNAATFGEYPTNSGTLRWVDSGSASTTGRFDIPEEP